MQVSVSAQLPKEVPVDQQGSWSYPHPVIGLVLQVGNVEKFPQALGFKSLDPFFSCKQGPCFKALEENGGDKRLAELELAYEADGVAQPDPD